MLLEKSLLLVIVVGFIMYFIEQYTYYGNKKQFVLSKFINCSDNLYAGGKLIIILDYKIEFRKLKKLEFNFIFILNL